jgi:transcriptional regulator with XRE-family HTH domain
MQEHPLRLWRKKHEVRLETLAAKVGVTASHLSEIERGLNRPSLGLAARLSAATGNKVRLSEFVEAAE